MSRTGQQNFLSVLLNKPFASLVCILIAFTCKAILTAVFSNYEGDKSFYLLLAENLGAGKGFTIPVTLLSNPTVTNELYLPSAVSPLYSILATPLLQIFPGNYPLVTWIIESFAWFCLFIVLHRLLRFLRIERFWVNVFILFSGFFIYNVELSSSSKDVLSTTLIFLAFLQVLLISTKTRASILFLFLSSLIFILPGLTKFMYLPLTLVFPLSLLFIYLLTRQKSFLRAGIITLLFGVLLVAGHYLFFHSLDINSAREHSAFYFLRWSLAKGGNDFVKGFYPENLLLLYPYMPASLINLDVIGVWVRASLTSLYKAYGILLSLVNLAGILGWAGQFIYICRKYYRKNISLRIRFFIIGSIISFFMLLVACYLSARYHAIEYKGGFSSWTYVFENRPFIFSIIFIQLILLVFLFSKKPASIFFSRFRTLIMVLMSIGLLHGMYFIAKTAINPASVKEKIPSINKLVMRDADSIRKSNPGYDIWIATEMQHLDWYAKLQKQKLFNHLVYLNDSSFHLPPKTILLSVLQKEDSAKISAYRSFQRIDSSWDYGKTWFIMMEKSE